MRIAAASILVLAVVSNPLAARAGTLNRPRDPVVILGEALDPLLGMQVDKIVAFRYDGQWLQIPVQVDERMLTFIGQVWGDDTPGPETTMAYTDPTTYTGPDVDPFFDADDEIVFMPADAGDRVPPGVFLPDGVSPETGAEVTVQDPLDGGVGCVYLFRTNGTLDPSAGQDYVSYTFDLLAGTYLPDYNLGEGRNPENSEVVSPYYHTHFADRWIRDELHLFTDGATGVDILDRHKNMFSPGLCWRTEDTFCDGAGAFFANKDGPVRAIRSYMGANSGPLTQREHIFYAQRHDIATILRVHPIPSVMDMYDYSPGAAGMMYYNDFNTGGLLVDGQPDAAVPGQITWEMVTGDPGTLVMFHWIETDIPDYAHTLYYSDNTTPPVTQCTGDAFEYATSGLFVNQDIPNTDPMQGEHNTLVSHRTVYYETPHQSLALAQQRTVEAQTPFNVSVEPYPQYTGDYDGDHDVDQADVLAFLQCMSGPAVPVDAGCEDRDWDGDGDADQNDFGLFQRFIGF